MFKAFKGELVTEEYSENLLTAKNKDKELKQEKMSTYTNTYTTQTKDQNKASTKT